MPHLVSKCIFLSPAILSIVCQASVIEAHDVKNEALIWSQFGTIPGNTRTNTVLTQNGVYVFGEASSRDATPENSFFGFVVNATSSSVEKMALQNLVEPRSEPSALSTGNEVLVWGGQSDGLSGVQLHDDGARFDPGTSKWNRLRGEGAPEARVSHAAAWSGREMIVWGGKGLSARNPPPFGYAYLQNGGPTTLRKMSGES